jgi:hypothetical protein
MDTTSIFHEAKNDEPDLTSKKAIVSFIASNLMRFVNKPDADDRGLILLVAALSVLNLGEDSTTINIARRLATASLVTKTRGKD